MSYINITKINDEDDSYRVDYSVDHKLYDIIVDRKTAELLEHAKKAGAAERAREIRQLLEMNW